MTNSKMRDALEEAKAWQILRCKITGYGKDHGDDHHDDSCERCALIKEFDEVFKSTPPTVGVSDTSDLVHQARLIAIDMRRRAGESDSADHFIPVAKWYDTVAAALESSHPIAVVSEEMVDIGTRLEAALAILNSTAALLSPGNPKTFNVYGKAAVEVERALSMLKASWEGKPWPVPYPAPAPVSEEMLREILAEELAKSSKAFGGAADGFDGVIHTLANGGDFPDWTWPHKVLAAMHRVSALQDQDGVHPGPGWTYDPLHAMRCSHGYTAIDGCSAGCYQKSPTPNGETP